MIKLGTNTIGKVYLGSNSIGKAYLGSNLVFQKGSSPTPTPYTLVDYIETDGTAYINTGIKGNAPMSSKINLIPVVSASGNTYFFGCRKDSGDTRFSFCLLTSDKKATFAYGAGVMSNGLDISSSVDNGTEVTIQTRFKVNSQIIYKKEAGESSYTNSGYASQENVQTDTDIFVFCLNNQGSPGTILDGLKIRHVMIYSDYDWTNLVFDGNACYYNGEYGMWDMVSDTFFGNAAGSGAFTGPSI